MEFYFRRERKVTYGPPEECGMCKGKGEYYYSNLSNDYEDPGWKHCWHCNGTGLVQVQTKTLIEGQHVPYNVTNQNY